MTQMNVLSVYEKIQNACFQLNSDAFSLQSRKKRIRQFSPCEKSVFLLDCLRKETHFGIAMVNASQIQCGCHNNLTYDGLLEMCFNDTERKKHYFPTGRNTTARF